jgi:type III pantothenate kinase
MYLIGDIGNSEIKICLINQKNIIIKRINFSNSNSSLKDLNKNLKKLKNYFPKIEKILFCSVVPNSFKLIKKFLKTKTKIK